MSVAIVERPVRSAAEAAVDARMAALVRDPGFHADPYPAYREFRAHPGWVTPSGYQVFSSYRDVQTIMRDFEAFGQEGIPYPNFHVLNPPEHTRIRKLVTHAFTQRAVNQLLERIEGFVDELIASLRPGGRMELMEAFALQLPGMVGASMLGVPFKDIPAWNDWLWAIGEFRGKTHYLAEGTDEAKQMASGAAGAAATYFRELIAERRETRGSDIVSALLAAREGDDRLSEDELLYTLVLILGGSLHTTASQIGNTLRALFENPRAYAEARANPELAGGLVDEGLRYDGSLQAEYRLCRQDTVVSGVEVRKGTLIIVSIGAANRDPEQFPDPDSFDIRRGNAGQHLTFGMGIHRCLGAQLARSEMKIAFEKLFVQLPDLRADGEPVLHQFDRWRGLKAYPVTWTAAA